VSDATPPRTTYVGIDNGITGAVAIILPDGLAQVTPVPVRKVGADTRIDARVLWEIFLALPNPHIVFEIGQKQPAFGVKGNYANGRSHGVLETLVELRGCPYRPVNPKDWQKDAFAGLRGWDMDTKAAAFEFCRRTFPTVSLLPTPRCVKPNDGMADALCMAWWAKNRAF
jgi:hypothetical protein